jgi:hypothetical protein
MNKDHKKWITTVNTKGAITDHEVLSQWQSQADNQGYEGFPNVPSCLSLLAQRVQSVQRLRGTDLKDHD